MKEARKNGIMRSFIISALHQALLGCSNQTGWDGWNMQCA
jgi:hypothetical protein